MLIYQVLNPQLNSPLYYKKILLHLILWWYLNFATFINGFFFPFLPFFGVFLFFFFPGPTFFSFLQHKYILVDGVNIVPNFTLMSSCLRYISFYFIFDVLGLIILFRFFFFLQVRSVMVCNQYRLVRSVLGLIIQFEGYDCIGSLNIFSDVYCLSHSILDVYCLQ